MNYLMLLIFNNVKKMYQEFYFIYPLK